MRLRRKTLLVIGVTLVGLIGVLYTTSSKILLDGFTHLEEQDTRQNVQRVLEAFSDDLAKLNFTVRDWAEWDDTYAFIQDVNSTYLTSNLNDATAMRLKVNLMLYINSSGETVFTKAFDLNRGKSIPVPSSILTQLSGNSPLLQRPLKEGHLTGIWQLPEGPMLISSRPILTGEGKGPSRGILIMGRYLNSDEVDQLADRTHLSLTMHQFDDAPMPADFQRARVTLASPQTPPSPRLERGSEELASTALSPIAVQPLSANIIAGYTQLRDIYGQPVVLLRVEIPRSIYKQGQASLFYLILSVVAVGLVFSGGTLFLLEKIVLSRLSRLSAGVSWIGESSNLSLRVAIKGSDELSRLADNINGMLEALADSQQQLRQNQEKYESVVNNLKEVIFQTDMTGLWTFLNPAWAEMTGFPVTQSIGTNCLNYVHPNDHQSYAEQSEALIEARTADCRYEVRCLTKDGGYRWVEVFARLTLDADGNKLGTSGTLNDITERKTSGEAIHLLQTLTDAISESKDFHLALEVALRRVCEATSWDYGEAWTPNSQQTVLELSSIWYINPHEDRPSISALEKFRRLSETFIPESGVGLAERVWSSQQPEWIQNVSIQPVQVFLRVPVSTESELGSGFGVPIIADNEVLAVLVFFMFESREEDKRLVTLVSAVAAQLGAVLGRKRTEEALRQAEEKYRTIFENAIEGIFQTTPDGRYLSANRALARLHGYESPKEFISTFTNIAKQLYVDPKRRDQFVAAIEDQGSVSQFESQIYTRYGSIIWISEDARAVRDSAGNLLYYEGTVKDITQRKWAEEQVVLLQTMMLKIGEAPDFDSAVSAVLQTVCETKGWNYGEAWIPALEENVLKCSPAWYSNATSLEKFRRFSEEYTFAPELGIPGRVWSSRQPEWRRDVSSESEQAFSRTQIAQECGLKAALGIPIIASVAQSAGGEPQVVAVLVFFMFQSCEEDKPLVDLVSAVAAQLGSVLGQKAAEEAMRQAEAKYRIIYENATEGIFQTTPDGRFLSANPALARIYGYNSPQELISQMHDIGRQLYIDPQRRTQFIAAMQKQDVLSGFESLAYRKDGSAIWISENVRAVRDVDGAILYYEGTVENITARKVAAEALRYQQEQSEALLLNTLPAPIAQRLKMQESSIADSFAEVTVMFADIVGFTQLSENIPPTDLVNLLNTIFSAFDQLTERHGLEKIKTIGDAYMVVGGLPIPRSDHAQAIADMALDMQKSIADFNAKTGEAFSIRIGINTGPVVAGVIGIKKFIYDLWGDTVNTASRMESHGIPGRIQVSAETYARLQDDYQFEERGVIQVKGKGEMLTYLLTGRLSLSQPSYPQNCQIL